MSEATSTARRAHLVYRIESRGESVLSSIRRHVRGKFSEATLRLPDLHQLAHGTPGGAVALRPSATPGEMRQWRNEAKQTRGRGKPPVPWCEAVFVGAKIIDWPPAKGRAWAEACVAAFERLMPHAKLIEAQLHTRESEWHVHVVAQPRGIDQLGRVKCSKNAMLRTAIEVETGEPPPFAGRRGRKRHGEDCTALQDAFHQVCGEPFGLLRGDRDSKARHTPIDDERRAEVAAREAEELARRREAELAEVVDFNAAREKLAEERQQHRLRKQRLDAAIAKFNEHARAAREKRRQSVKSFNAEVVKLRARRAAVREQEATATACIGLLDACLAEELSPAMTLEALMAARIDHPLPEEAAAAVERQIRRRQAAARSTSQEGAAQRVNDVGWTR